MDIDMEVEKRKIELKRVKMAREEMLFKILERKVDIERLQGNVEIQEKRMLELEKIINKGL